MHACVWAHAMPTVYASVPVWYRPEEVSIPPWVSPTLLSEAPAFCREVTCSASVAVNPRDPPVYTYLPETTQTCPNPISECLSWELNTGLEFGLNKINGPSCSVKKRKKKNVYRFMTLPQNYQKGCGHPSDKEPLVPFSWKVKHPTTRVCGPTGPIKSLKRQKEFLTNLWCQKINPQMPRNSQQAHWDICI